MRPRRCVTLLTKTVRCVMSCSKPVRAKWPKKFTPIVASKPSRVSVRTGCMTPALLTSKSMRLCCRRKLSAQRRTEVRSAKSRWTNSVLASGLRWAMVARAAAAAGALRQASTTVAPSAARPWATSMPMPLLAPVITATRPSWRLARLSVHGWFVIAVTGYPWVREVVLGGVRTKARAPGELTSTRKAMRR